jgi:hypothetical protein
MKTICADFSTVSLYVNEWLLGQPALKEESATDWLLYEISKRRREVIYHAWTRHAEARLGADWWWVLLFPSGVFFFHVQAKKLKLARTGNNFSGLAHPKNTGAQIGNLLKTSAAVSALPMYAFYSGISTSGLCAGRKGPDEGVYLAPAHKVDALMKASRKVTSDDLLKLSIPLSCLVCCPLTLGGGANRLKRLLHRYFVDGTSPAPPGYFDATPSHVQKLLDEAADATAREATGEPDESMDSSDDSGDDQDFGLTIDSPEGIVRVGRLLITDMRDIEAPGSRIPFAY